MGDTAYTHIVNDRDLQILSSLPDHFLESGQNFKAAAPRKRDIHFVTFSMSKKRKIPAGFVTNNWIETPNKIPEILFEEASKLEKMGSSLREEERLAFIKTKAIVTKSSSIKTLLATWPEIKPLVDKLDLQRFEPGKALVDTSSLNKQLGLPPK